MKKTFFAFVLLLSLSISFTADAQANRGFRERSVTEIQAFFNVQVATSTIDNMEKFEKEKIRLTHEALVFHLSKLQKKLNQNQPKPAGENTYELCIDGIDNDFDIMIDMSDSDCSKFTHGTSTYATMTPATSTNNRRRKDTPPAIQKSSFFENYFKNVQAQVLFMFEK